MARASLRDWPRLTRFYGIGPSELASLPHAVITMYAEQLPSIQAEETELAIMVSDMPHAEEKDRKSVFRRLGRFIRPEPTPEPVQRRYRRREKPSSPINEQAAAAFGFKVVRGDRKPSETGAEPAPKAE
jgi:hypothetical protein